MGAGKKKSQFNGSFEKFKSKSKSKEKRLDKPHKQKRRER